MKRKIFSLICFILILSFVLPSCASTVSDAIDTLSSDTADTENTEQELSPDDIVYEDEDMPAVYITTSNNYQVTSKTQYTECTVKIVLNDRYMQYQSTYTDEDGGDAQIRCRGNMTYRLEDMKAKNKYSYKIKLDKKADVLGMGKSKHWLLINSWRDPGYQRNKIAYDYSAMLGLDHVDSQWVNVYYNGEYRGVYILAESIRIADDRVEIFSWEDFTEDMADLYADDHGYDADKRKALCDHMEEDMSWVTSQMLYFTYGNKTEKIEFYDYYDPDALDFTSGYLIESCQGAIGSETVNWYTKKNVPISVDSPSRLTNSYMLDYVRTLIQDFENALFSPTYYNDKGKHYSEYVDVDSMVDYWMVWNFFLNNEFSLRSLFFYIEDGKIVWGPCWDFDQTMGNVMTVPEKWAEPNYWLEDRNNAWWLEIFGDPWFTSLCQERWFEMRELNDVFLQTYDIYYDYIEDDAAVGYAYDGERYLKVNRPNVNNGHSFNPKEDYVFIKAWLKKRIQWLDQNFAIKDPNIDSSGNQRSSKIFVKVSQNQNQLEADNLTVYGVNADYLLSSDSTDALSINVSTTHSAVAYVDAYLNGSTRLGKKNMSSSTTATYTVDLSMLDMSNDALNVIYFIAYRSDGTIRAMSSVYIRVSDLSNPTADEFVVEFGDEKMIVKSGTEIIVPEKAYSRDGYVFCGWVTSLTSTKEYQPGDTITVTRNMSLYMRFKPIDMCSEFVLDEYKKS